MRQVIEKPKIGVKKHKLKENYESHIKLLQTSLNVTYLRKKYWRLEANAKSNLQNKKSKKDNNKVRVGLLENFRFNGKKYNQ